MIVHEIDKKRDELIHGREFYLPYTMHIRKDNKGWPVKIKVAGEESEVKIKINKKVEENYT